MSGGVIAVTGASGTIGTELVHLLAAAGAPTRAVFRRDHEKRDLPGVVWLHADLRDTRTHAPTLAGTRHLFLLTGNEAGFGPLQIDLVHAAEANGVEHVVKLSALGA